jgi:hypothetical protein
MSAVSAFGLPLSAPSITLTDPAGLVTDAVTADVVTAATKVVTPLVTPASPTAGTGAAGTGLGISAATGATSAGTAGGKGGDLGLSAGAAGAGTASANGGSVILRPGNGFAPGVSGLVRVTNGPLVTSGGTVNLGAATPIGLTVDQLRNGILYGTPGAPSTYNLPTAATILQGLPGLQIGDRLEFSVTNIGSATITVDVLALSGITKIGAAAGLFQITVGEHASRFALVATNVTVAAFDFLRIA